MVSSQEGAIAFLMERRMRGNSHVRCGVKAGDCLKGLPITITLPVWLERRRESQLVRQSEADDSHGFRQAVEER